MQQLTLFLFILIHLHSYGEVIDSMPAGEYPDRIFSREEIEQVISQSNAFRGLPKIKSMDSLAVILDSARWPMGSWGRGYQTWPTLTHNAFMNLSDNNYFAHHPLVRDVACFVRGHLHLYLAGYTDENRIIVTDGIDYLLSQQHTTGEGSGGFDWWISRDGKTSIYMSENAVHPFETCYALVALSEYYLSAIDYRRQDVYDGVQKASTYVAKLDWKKFDNANHRALGLWALSSAYKVTGDSCLMIEIKYLTTWLINKQYTGNDAENGLWKTGGKDGGGKCQYWHDTRMIYHFFMIRGLVEAFSIIPDYDIAFKTDLANALKHAINHVINYRLASSSPTIPDLVYVYKDRCGNTASAANFLSLDVECYIDAMVKICYYSRNSDYFTSLEQKQLHNLTNKMAAGLDPGEKWHTCAIGIYANYMNALQHGTKVLE